MNRILIVDDSSEALELMKRALGNMRVDCARTIGEATELLKKIDFDLILLDVMMPDGDGFKFCSWIRSDERLIELPIIFVTSKNSAADQVFGFSVGADDYLPKPFDAVELKARVMARLRRRNMEKVSVQVRRFGDIEINKDTQRVTLYQDAESTELDLTPLEFKLLVFLSKEPGKVISRDEILTGIWGENVHVYSRSVDTHISKLRKKLGPQADCISSVHGAGYRFIAPEPNITMVGFEHFSRGIPLEFNQVLNQGSAAQ